jgi:CRP/FNR family transcriptional regulator, cyclic AMP receptor protein
LTARWSEKEQPARRQNRSDPPRTARSKALLPSTLIKDENFAYEGACDSEGTCFDDSYMTDCVPTMPKNLHSQDPPENSGRSVGAPALFASFPESLQTELRKKAIRRSFSSGQFLYHRGDAADGFWVVESGQIKLGHQDAQGNMHVLFILGAGDSFGELACLGQFDRVLDAEALGKTEMSWVSDKIFFEVVGRSPEISREMLKILAKQLQEALDNLLVFRNMPAPKRLAQRLLAFAGDRPPPVKLGMRQQELAELIGVSRMTIASALAELEQLGMVSRHYGHLVVEDTTALRLWMKKPG